ncbi:MAG: sigma-70 family RNA polymerase sigma factor [Pirellulaceae bacterium]|nr:sigma-70 family RNA polymerase sigma factor [Pirellulaceae bacterium]
MSQEIKDSTVNVPALVDQWRAGDQDAATALYNRYQNRLLMLVSGHLSDKLRRRLDPDELVQSIMKSAFRVTSEQDIGCHDETGFWKWLVTVALNKTFKRIDRETASKRDPKRETGGDTVLGERILRDPTPDDVVEVSELLEKILAKLTDVQGKILLGKLDGLSQSEIATQLGVSTKTIQRNGPAIRDAAVSVMGRDVPEWLVDAEPLMAEQFSACLNEPVANWLPTDLAASLGNNKKQKLIDVLEQATPNEAILNGIRSVSKDRGSSSDSERPQLICAAVYLLAIATARVKLDKRISSDDDHKLKARVETVLKESWLGRPASDLLRDLLHAIDA